MAGTNRRDFMKVSCLSVAAVPILVRQPMDATTPPNSAFTSSLHAAIFDPKGGVCVQLSSRCASAVSAAELVAAAASLAGIVSIYSPQLNHTDLRIVAINWAFPSSPSGEVLVSLAAGGNTFLDSLMNGSMTLASRQNLSANIPEISAALTASGALWGASFQSVSLFGLIPSTHTPQDDAVECDWDSLRVRVPRPLSTAFNRFISRGFYLNTLNFASPTAIWKHFGNAA